MLKVWLRIVGAVACFAAALWLTDGDHSYRDHWVIAVLLLIAGVVLEINAGLARVRIALHRANERHEQEKR